MLGLTSIQTTIVLLAVVIGLLLLGGQLVTAVRDVRVARWTGARPADSTDSGRNLTGRALTADEVKSGRVEYADGKGRPLEADELLHRRLDS